MTRPNAGFLAWIKRLFRNNTLDNLSEDLRQIGQDARVAGEIVEVRSSSIASVSVEDKGGSQRSNWYMHFAIPDYRLLPAHGKIRIRARNKLNFPVFGVPSGLYWKGNSLGLGITDQLNQDDSLSPDNISNWTPEFGLWLDRLGSVEVRARPDRWCWVLTRKGRDAPSRREWESYEAIARHILDTPVPSDPQSLHHLGEATVAHGSVAQEYLQLEIVQPNRILGMLDQRSWLWRFHSGETRRAQCLQRITTLQALLPSITDRLIKQGVLEPRAELGSVYVIGRFPWVPNSADIDLFLIIEGEYDWIPFTSEELKAWDVQVPELPAELAVEVVGRETLNQATQGEPVPNAKRLVLRHTLLYGSVLLAGPDIFEGTSITRGALEAFRKDLLEDRRRQDWPELGGDTARIKAKRKWRQTEANALRQFRSHFLRTNSD